MVVARRANRVLCSLGLTLLMAMIPQIDSASNEDHFGSGIIGVWLKMMIILLRRAKRVLCSLGLTLLMAMIPPIDSASKELQFGSTMMEFGKK